ncbi:hypothetical protein ACVDG8_026980 [Mesorhizobium sp. ORM8.1]
MNASSPAKADLLIETKRLSSPSRTEWRWTRRSRSPGSASTFGLDVGFIVQAAIVAVMIMISARIYPRLTM